VGTLRQQGREVDAARLDFDQGPEVIQRRQFVRIETSTTVTLTRADGTKEKTFTLNLSGAGLLLGGPADLAMDDAVKVDIDVGEGEVPIHARGRVVRETSEGHKGVRIEMIEEGDRERLIHFVFERQRSQPRVKT
jgi:c-di-GMP-binding flagellar brake protein YcgR